MKKFKVNDLCNAVSETEQLVYLGFIKGRNENMHIFARVVDRYNVYRDVPDTDVSLFEHTKDINVVYEYNSKNPIYTFLFNCVKDELSKSPTLPTGTLMRDITIDGQRDEFYLHGPVKDVDYEITYTMLGELKVPTRIEVAGDKTKTNARTVTAHVDSHGNLSRIDTDILSRDQRNIFTTVIKRKEDEGFITYTRIPGLDEEPLLRYSKAPKDTLL